MKPSQKKLTKSKKSKRARQEARRKHSREVEKALRARFKNPLTQCERLAEAIEMLWQKNS
jgi:hypothetical protein